MTLVTVTLVSHSQPATATDPSKERGPPTFRSGHPLPGWLILVVFGPPTQPDLGDLTLVTFLETHTQSYNIFSKCYFGGSIMLHNKN